MELTRRGVLVLAGGLPCWLAARKVNAAVHPIASFAGTYRYVGGQKQITKLHAAIDEVCQEMNFVFRQFAQPRLEKSLKPVPKVEFRVSGSQTTIVRPGIPTMQGNVDGGRFSWKDKRGVKSNVTFRWNDDALKISVKQSDGQSQLNWHFKDEGRMTLRMKIEHEKLPSPLRYALSYKR